MAEQDSPQIKFDSHIAIGEGVPSIVQPRMFHDEHKQWAYDIPEDVTAYLKNQLGKDIQVVVPDVPAVSMGYCTYKAIRNGEVVGGLRLGGDYSKPGAQSAWFLFRKQVG